MEGLRRCLFRYALDADECRNSVLEPWLEADVSWGWFLLHDWQPLGSGVSGLEAAGDLAGGVYGILLPVMSAR